MYTCWNEKSIGGINMAKKKPLILGSTIFLLLIIIATIFTSYNLNDIRLKMAINNLYELISNENIDDTNLTIYYYGVHFFTPIPLTVDDLINGYVEQKIIINSSGLKEHIDLFKQISTDDLIPIKENDDYSDIRLYYVLESDKLDKSFGVAMAGAHGIFVNGVEVEDNVIFCDVLAPFMSKDTIEEIRYYFFGMD